MRHPAIPPCWLHRFPGARSRAPASPGLLPYDHRHSAATILTDAGQSPKTVAAMLGRSKIELTLNTYTHVTPNLLERVADRLEDLIVGRETPGQRRG